MSGGGGGLISHCLVLNIYTAAGLSALNHGALFSSGPKGELAILNVELNIELLTEFLLSSLIATF